MNFSKTWIKLDTVSKKILLCLFITALSLPERVFSLELSAPLIIIGLFDSGEGSPHQKLMSKHLESLIKPHPYKILYFPIYNRDGTLTTEQFTKALSEAKINNVTLYHFSWNLPSNSKTQGIEKSLQKLASDPNSLIVAAAGVNSKHLSKPLKFNQTIWGRVSPVFIIGELNSFGRLEIHSNYGDELFTALPSFPDKKGSSYSSLRFTATLAKSAHSDNLNSLKQKLLALRKKFVPSHKKLFLNLKDISNTLTKDKK